jgi:hypothetical protein
MLLTNRGSFIAWDKNNNNKNDDDDDDSNKINDNN